MVTLQGNLRTGSHFIKRCHGPQYALFQKERECHSQLGVRDRKKNPSVYEVIVEDMKITVRMDSKITCNIKPFFLFNISCPLIKTKLLWKFCFKHGNSWSKGCLCWSGSDMLSNWDLTWTYRQISNISRTKSQILNVSCIVLRLSWPKPLKPGVKSRMTM